MSSFYDIETGNGNTTKQTNSNTTNSNVGCCCGLFCTLIVFGMLSSIGIAELVMLGKYGDQMTCDSPVISLNTWLLVDGIMGIINAVVLMLSLGLFTQLGASEEAVGCFVLINWPFSAFKMAWLIVGSITFWRDCSHMAPEPINSLMYAVLIIGYILLYTSIQATNKKKD